MNFFFFYNLAVNLVSHEFITKFVSEKLTSSDFLENIFLNSFDIPDRDNFILQRGDLLNFYKSVDHKLINFLDSILFNKLQAEIKPISNFFQPVFSSKKKILTKQPESIANNLKSSFFLDKRGFGDFFNLNFSVNNFFYYSYKYDNFLFDDFSKEIVFFENNLKIYQNNNNFFNKFKGI